MSTPLDPSNLDKPQVFREVLPRQDQSPYCAFRNDRDRLFALVSRDLRIVIVFVVAAVAGMHIDGSTWRLLHALTSLLA